MKKNNTKTHEWKLTPLRRCALNLGKTKKFTPKQLAFRWAIDTRVGAWPETHRKQFGLLAAAYRSIYELHKKGYLALQKDEGKLYLITTQEGAKLI